MEANPDCWTGQYRPPPPTRHRRNQAPVTNLGAQASRPQARTGGPPPEARRLAKRAGRPRSQVRNRRLVPALGRVDEFKES